MHKPKKIWRIPASSLLYASLYCLALYLLPGKVLADETTAKIHVITLPAGSEALLLESCDADGNPIFGMIDAGEDQDYPDGSNPAYPLRPGIVLDEGNDTDVLSYLDSMGVNSGNFEFLICSHPHSDHIVLADTLIDLYLPKRVYLPYYSDSCIQSESHLWDNLYVYDQAREACLAHPEVTLIQHLEAYAENYQDRPDFNFGAFQISIVNYEEDFLETPARDANQFALAVIARSNGHTCFVGTDVDNTDGDLDKILERYDLKNVDVLVSNHHGYSASNEAFYLQRLSPKYYLQTGRYSFMEQETISILQELGSKIFSVAGFYGTFPALIADFSDAESHCTADGSMIIYTSRNGQLVCYKDGVPYDGFFTLGDVDYYAEENGILKRNTIWRDPADNILYSFDENGHRSSAENSLSWVNDWDHWYYQTESGMRASGWIFDNNNYYYLNSLGQITTGWLYLEGKWHYFNEDGVLMTGWCQIDSDFYYLDPDENGALRTDCWYQDEEGSFHYLQSFGAAARNTTLTMDSYTYTFDENTLVSNAQWLPRNGYLYLLKDSRLCSGWVEVDGDYYYINEDGTVKRNSLFEDEGINYYVDENGTMASGCWKEIDGKHYFFRPWGGAYSNCWLIYQDHTYWINLDGSCQTGWMIRNDNTYFFDENGIMYTGKKIIDGKTYIFDSHGVLK